MAGTTQQNDVMAKTIAPVQEQIMGINSVLGELYHTVSELKERVGILTPPTPSSGERDLLSGATRGSSQLVVQLNEISNQIRAIEIDIHDLCGELEI